jgi:hypothetical protein
MAALLAYEINDASIDDALTPTFPHLMSIAIIATSNAERAADRKRRGFPSEALEREEKSIKKSKGRYEWETVNIGRGGKIKYLCLKD